VSVILPARDVAALIPGQLQALSVQTYAGPWEVVVADNGSNDSTTAAALAWRSQLPGLKVVDASDNAGINYARNLGVSCSKGDLLVFCDADDEASPEWLEAMVGVARFNDTVGGPLETSRLNTTAVQHENLPVQDRLPRISGFLSYAVGANCAVWRDVFDDLGGFDEMYKGGGDETDFFLRAQLAGFTLGFAPNAVMHYRRRDRLAGLARQYYGYGKAGPTLYRRFRANGMPRSSLPVVFRSWASIVLRSHYLFRGRAQRRQWIRAISMRVGKIVGSVKCRVLYL
jgi:glycosyltransferase involved in cell wall biosynthesis